jgi:hypothetical protein
MPTTTTTSTTVPEPQAPSLVITEIMPNPDAQSDSTGEYFEVLNTGAGAIDLLGATFRDDGSNSFTVGASLVAEPGQHIVFGRSETAADGLVDYVYGSAMSLANSADQIVIEIDGVVVDAVAYDAAFPLAVGASMSLDPGATTATANDTAANWCESTQPMTDGDRGSPRAAAAPCAVE